MSINGNNNFLTNLQYVIYAAPVVDGESLPLDKCKRIHCRLTNNREVPKLNLDENAEIYPNRSISSVFGCLVEDKS